MRWVMILVHSVISHWKKAPTRMVMPSRTRMRATPGKSDLSPADDEINPVAHKDGSQKGQRYLNHRAQQRAQKIPAGALCSRAAA